MHGGPPELVNSGQTRRAVHSVQDLIRQLLERDPAKRLGAHAGAEEIKAHPFYEEINWVRPCTAPRVEGCRVWGSGFFKYHGTPSTRRSTGCAPALPQLCCSAVLEVSLLSSHVTPRQGCRLNVGAFRLPLVCCDDSYGLLRSEHTGF